MSPKPSVSMRSAQRSASCVDNNVAPSKWNLKQEASVARVSLFQLYMTAPPVEIPPCLTVKKYLEIVQYSLGD